MWQRWNYNSQPMLEIHAESRNTTANVMPKFANPYSMEVKIKKGRGGRVSILPAYDHPHPPPPLYILGWRMRSCSLCTTDLYSGPVHCRCGDRLFFLLLSLLPIKLIVSFPGGSVWDRSPHWNCCTLLTPPPSYIEKNTLLVMRIRWRNICMW